MGSPLEPRHKSFTRGSLMPRRPSTDNFLLNRAKISRASQPIIYAPTPSFDERAKKGNDTTAQSQAALENHQSPDSAASPKTSRKKWAVLAGATVIIGVSVGIMSLSIHTRPIKPLNVTQVTTMEKPPKAAAQAAIITDWPVRVEIPKINVNASLDYVGLTPQGALDAPKVPEDAGWYDKGPRPGEAGTAIIDGHFGWKNNIPAAFDNLNLLQKGDMITVIDDEGNSTNFVVSNVETYAENQAANAIFTTAGAGAHLNLITCKGTWNAAQESYSNRLVVFANKE